MPRQSLMARRSQPPQVKATNPFGASAYSYSGGRLIAYNDKQETYISKGYQFNDIVYSAVRLITDKIRVAPWGIYTITDEQAYKQLQALVRKADWGMTDYKKARDLQNKSMKPVANAGKWQELMESPNGVDSHSDYVANGITYLLLTGNFYTKATLLDGGANAGYPQELLLPPAQFVSIDAVDSFPVIINNYSIASWPNAKWEPREILHEKMFNPDWGTSGSHLYGQSPLRALLRRLKKNNALVDAEASTFDNEGVKGILHMKAQPGSVDGDALIQEVERLKATMVKEWTGTANRGRIGLGAYDMGWLPVGFTSEDMQLIASNLQDLRQICNVFGGLPSQLLNDPENKIYSNMKEGEKALTSRCVLPHLCQHKWNFTRKAKKDWKFNPSWVYDFDMSVFSELASDMAEIVTATSGMIATIPNEQREQAGLAAYPDPIFDQPWIMSGGNRIPLEDFQQSQTDQALNNDPNDAGNL